MLHTPTNELPDENYVGRPSPLYFARGLTEYLGAGCGNLRLPLPGPEVKKYDALL